MSPRDILLSLHISSVKNTVWKIKYLLPSHAARDSSKSGNAIKSSIFGAVQHPVQIAQILSVPCCCCCQRAVVEIFSGTFWSLHPLLCLKNFSISAPEACSVTNSGDDPARPGCNFLICLHFWEPAKDQELRFWEGDTVGLQKEQIPWKIPLVTTGINLKASLLFLSNISETFLLWDVPGKTP